MTPKIAHGVGFVLLVSALAVFALSIWQSAHGTRSTGLSVLGTLLLIMGIGIRVQSRRFGGK
jgi:putative exporter of polyketide antibiotics